MRPGKMRHAARSRELADEARQAALAHGVSPREGDETGRDVARIADERPFVL